MITFYYIGNYGRFGNQMFQYATLRSVAHKTGHRAVLPIPPKTTNSYQRFVLDEAFCGLSIEYKNISPPPKTYQEKSMRFDGSIFSIEDGTDIIGYFQSEKYFAEISELIRKEFCFKKEIQQSVDDRYKTVLNDHYAVSLHVRRGDYVNLQDTHPLCTEEYYRKALDLMPKDAKIVVISDDINWCKNNLSHLHGDMVFSDNKNSYEDMYLMSKCRANIIANSSFSWWGAWLADGDRVVAPKKWFGKNDIDSSDIIPERWIKI